MYILGICEDGDVLSTIKFINKLILIIKIVVPIALIVSVMIDYTKAVLNHEELNMTNKLFINKIAAAILIFLIPTLVNITIDLVDPNGVSYIGCMRNATNENIDQAYANTADKYIEIVKKTLLHSDYSTAKSKVAKVKNDDLRKPLEEKLKDLYQYVQLYEEIEKVAASYTRERYVALKEKIEKVTDPTIKETLLKKLKDSFKSKASLAEFDLDPNSSLYSGLKPLTGITLAEVLKKNGSTVDELNQKIQTAVENAGVGTREAAAMAGMTLIDELAHMGYAIHYDWGGKWYNIGVDGNWGSRISPQYCSSYPTPSYCESNFIWKGFDCTGFVDWAIAQAFNDSTANEYNKQKGSEISLAGQTTAICDIGDALNKPGSHITLIVGIDEASKNYIVAESTTGGERLKLSYYPFNNYNYNCWKINYVN